MLLEETVRRQGFPVFLLKKWKLQFLLSPDFCLHLQVLYFAPECIQDSRLWEMDAIAACVLGGTSMSGGKGRISGTVIGAMVIGIISNGLNLIGVSSYWQLIVKGLIIACAVLLDAQKDKISFRKKQQIK